MRLLHMLTGLLLVMGVAVVAGQAAFPKDIYPETGNRFPAINRQATPDSFGPAAIRIYSPPVADQHVRPKDKALLPIP